jgi:alkylation response protein AidB-like acyl-CoA dehydrogenase
VTPTHYRPHRRDLEFVLFELLGRDAVLAGPTTSLDPDTARAALAEVETLATGALAASFAAADRDPPHLDPATGYVHVPDAFRASFAAYRASEWWRLDLPATLGGPDCPPSLRWAVQELVLGANPALHMYACGYVFAGLLHGIGTPDQQRLAALMVEHGWGASMALTEDAAGSDLGAITTTAHPQPDGTWHLEGSKRFVTNGEHDLADNIVHFVLARPAGAAPGVRGLSLFVVPRHHVVLATGALGARNGVRAVRLEDKLGLRVSATCELSFGRHREPAVGHLVGGVHDGLAQVFRLVHDARTMVATKAMATLSSAYLNALEHARTRVQGRDLAHRGDPSAPSVVLAEHPDVARLLLDAKVAAEGLRALVLHAASSLDADGAPGRADLLLPIVKGYASERANTQTAAMFQVVGGAAYTRDLPYEQYLRDLRIDTVYEGTTGIQSLDLLFRQIVRDDGAALSGLLDEVGASCAPRDSDTLAAERAALRAAVADSRATVDALVALVDGARNRDAGAHATDLLAALGDLLTTWLLLRSADLAMSRLGDLAPQDGDASETESEAAFYRGKVLAARHAVRTLLPHVAALRAAVDATVTTGSVVADTAVTDL